MFFKTVSYESNWKYCLAILEIKNLTRIQRIFLSIFVGRTKPRSGREFMLGSSCGSQVCMLTTSIHSKVYNFFWMVTWPKVCLKETPIFPRSDCIQWPGKKRRKLCLLFCYFTIQFDKKWLSTWKNLKNKNFEKAKCKRTASMAGRNGYQ
jgi:hypothetical protein